jgi:D-mannonate dehydratase
MNPCGSDLPTALGARGSERGAPQVGGLHDFKEVWPDEGDVNMFRLAQTLHSVGYPYMLMPDHAPSHPDETNGHDSRGR